MIKEATGEWIHPSIECTEPLYSIASLLGELVCTITVDSPNNGHLGT